MLRVVRPRQRGVPEQQSNKSKLWGGEWGRRKEAQYEEMEMWFYESLPSPLLFIPWRMMVPWERLQYGAPLLAGFQLGLAGK